MKLSDECRMNMYQELTTIGNRNHVWLVREISSERIFIKKELSIYNKDIYTRLKEHPHIGIPHIYECIEDEEKLTIVEEFINGETLEDYVKRAGCRAEEEVIQIGMNICGILSVLHQMKPPIIYRDLNACNVMITENKELYLIDFNVAREFDQTQSRDTEFLGTWGYAAPEQYGFCGQSDGRTDIHGLGVLLNYLLIEKLPGEEIDSGRLGDVIRRCTQMKPDDRYANVDEAASELEKCLPGYGRKPEVSVSYHPSWLPPGFRTRTPWKMIAAVFGYAMIILICSGCTIEGFTQSFIQIPIKIMYFCMFLAEILFYANYRGLQNYFPLMKTKKWRIPGLILGGFLIIFVWLLVFFVFLAVCEAILQ